MPTTIAEDIALAKAILQTFHAQVMTPEYSHGFGNIVTHWSNACRDIARGYSEDGLSLPGTVRGVAATLVGLGQCQEMAQRFFWEYTKRTQRYDLTMLFLQAPNKVEKNHVLLVMHAHDESQARSDAQGHMLFNTVSAQSTLRDWLGKQSDKAVLIDPMLNVVCAAKNLPANFTAYCDLHHLTQVMGGHSMTKERFEFSVEDITEMQGQCEQMADRLQAALSIRLLNSVTKWFGIESTWQKHIKQSQPHLIIKEEATQLTKLKQQLEAYGVPPSRFALKKNNSGVYYLFLKNGLSHQPELMYSLVGLYKRAYQIDYALIILNRIARVALCQRDWMFESLPRKSFILRDQANKSDLVRLRFYLKYTGIDKGLLNIIDDKDGPCLRLQVTSLADNVLALTQALERLGEFLQRMLSSDSLKDALNKEMSDIQYEGSSAAAGGSGRHLASP